jgi:Flp pilus assembly protein TadG
MSRGTTVVVARSDSRAVNSPIVLGRPKTLELRGISLVAAPSGQHESARLLDTLTSVRERFMRSLRTRFALDERAQSLVEIALLMPMLIFLILAGGDLARAYALQLAVQNGARAGAEAAAIDFSPTVASSRARALDEMARTPGLSSTDPSLVITVTFKKTDGITTCGPADPTPLDPCWATVRVQYTFHTVTPWPLIPNTANFDRTTSMRTIKAP